MFPPPRKAQRLIELARLFFKLGVLGYGGPAAHIAMMESEVVQKRGWIEPQAFLDLIGATNLIPGPNSTEMTMHVGYVRAGWPGLLVAGLSFILPAAALTLLLSWAYVHTSQIPDADVFLAGIAPVVLVLIASAILRLGKKAVRTWPLFVIAAAVALAVGLGLGELPALFGGAITGALFLIVLRARSTESTPPSSPPARAPSKMARRALWGGAILVPALASSSAPTLDAIWWFFLKVGAVLYGSGYVLIAFLEGDVVERFGWLTQRELLDAVALGQLTPGPVLTTATAVGYLVAGVPGALVATAAIFLPSFLFAGLLHPLVPRLRANKWSSSGLDAVNAAAVALMAVVTVRLGFGLLTSPSAWMLAVLAGVAIWSGRVPLVVLIGGGVLLGAGLSWLGL